MVAKNSSREMQKCRQLEFRFARPRATLSRRMDGRANEWHNQECDKDEVEAFRCPYKSVS